MKRFFTLSFLFFSITLVGQNLIPDPSAEDFVECPTGLGILETWNPNWQSFRGTPDYFNNCSIGLGSNNPVGFQEPRTGEGYLGLVTFSRNLLNAREYLGVELVQPLITGEDYYLSFYVSRAHQFNAFNLASNNIGALLMTENYLNQQEQGPTPGFADFNVIEVVEDTVNWVHLSYKFVADSAYQYLAFGNFFVDALTDTLRIGGEPDGNVTSYYYFDDFCLTQNSNGCDFTNSINNQSSWEVSLFPNPCLDRLFIKQKKTIEKIEIYNITGEILESQTLKAVNQASINIDLPSGLYFISLYSEGKKTTKRFMVKY
jgi:hypothetical protein